MNAAELPEEMNLCETCHAAAGRPLVVDFPENPFATCEKCGAACDDVDLVAVKRDA